MRLIQVHIFLFDKIANDGFYYLRGGSTTTAEPATQTWSVVLTTSSFELLVNHHTYHVVINFPIDHISGDTITTANPRSTDGQDVLDSIADY